MPTKSTIKGELVLHRDKVTFHYPAIIRHGPIKNTIELYPWGIYTMDIKPLDRLSFRLFSKSKLIFQQEEIKLQPFIKELQRKVNHAREEDEIREEKGEAKYGLYEYHTMTVNQYCEITLMNQFNLKGRMIERSIKDRWTNQTTLTQKFRDLDTINYEAFTSFMLSKVVIDIRPN
jgi:hypothetical protein